MQSITDFWKTTTGKLTIVGSGGIAGLLSLCFICAICGALVRSNDATQKITSKPTKTPKILLPTETPAKLQPVATLVKLPTATPTTVALPPAETPMPEVLPTETLVPTETPKILKPLVTTGKDKANLRSGPGTNYEIVGVLPSGGSLEIVGRNSDSSWWQVSAQSSLAWVAAEVVTANNIDDTIPIVETSALPVQSTSTPFPQSTELPQQSSVASNDSAAGASTKETGGTPFECIGGCATPPDPTCAIKGNVNSKGEKIYHVPGGQYYDKTDIKPEEGDRWFCSEEEATNAGFRASER